MCFLGVAHRNTCEVMFTMRTVGGAMVELLLTPFCSALSALRLWPRRLPWQNAYCERVIGSIRRECTDHIIPLSEKHLLRTVREYQAYYNESRTHSSLDGNSPTPRPVAGSGEIISTPVLGGLHHRYFREAA